MTIDNSSVPPSYESATNSPPLGTVAAVSIVNGDTISVVSPAASVIPMLRPTIESHSKAGIRLENADPASNKHAFVLNGLIQDSRSVFPEADPAHLNWGPHTLGFFLAIVRTMAQHGWSLSRSARVRPATKDTMLFEYTGECKDPSDFFAMWVNDTKHTTDRGDVQFAGISESGMMVDTIQTAIRAAEHRRQNKLGLKQTPVLASYSVAGNGNIVFNNPYLGLHGFEGQSMIASIVAAINQAQFSVACCSRQLDPIMVYLPTGQGGRFEQEPESDIWIFQASSPAQLAATASALAEMADVQPMDQIACLMFKTKYEVRVIAGPLQVQETVLGTIKSTWPRGIKDRPRKYSSGLVTYPLKAAGMFTADIHDDIQAVRLYLCTLAQMAHEGWKLAAKATVGEEVLHYFVPAPRVYEVPAIFSISLTGTQIVEIVCASDQVDHSAVVACMLNVIETYLGKALASLPKLKVEGVSRWKADGHPWGSTVVSNRLEAELSRGFGTLGFQLLRAACRDNVFVFVAAE